MMDMDSSGIIARQKLISIAVAVGFVLFLLMFVIEKSKIILKMIPMVRGEVSVSKTSEFVITTTSDGSPIVVKKNDPGAGSELRFSGQVRSKFNSILRRFCNDNTVVVEIGPNFGYNTIPLGKNLRIGGKVYAFEASSSICSALRKTIALNSLDDKVVVKNIAISDHEGDCKIPDYASIHEVEEGVYSNPRIMNVACNTIDTEMAEEERPVDLISMDIPGMEIQILESCMETIGKSPDIVIVTTFDNDPIVPNAIKTLQKLERMGMRFYIAKNKNTYNEVTAEELMQKQEVILVITRRTI